MRKITRLVTGSGATLLSSVAFATPEEVLGTIWQLGVYGFILFLVVVAGCIVFMRWRDKRGTPLDTVFEERKTVHSVAPDISVLECVRKMTSEKIGAIIVIDGEKLVGIFTERDALNKVLAAGLDPISTTVSQVMTRDPCCVSPSTPAGDAMELITRRKFRHLPIVKDGKVVAVISSGDLTHWLVKDQLGDVQELVELAARS
ncbi:MAG: CBS domain-containing protein [Betaproteobacteria bacterium]|nr:CBS domain-containing protein [Betaproteobacteria bacterium]